MAKRCDAAAGADDNAATPQLALALACLVQTNGGPTRLLGALLCGSNHGIDTRSRTAKAIEYLLDSDHGLIVKCIVNSEHHAIDCTGIIRLQIDRVGERGARKLSIGGDGILQVPEQKLKIGAIGNADIRNGVQRFWYIAARGRLHAASFPVGFRLGYTVWRRAGALSYCNPYERNAMRLPMNTSLATLKPSGIRRINALAAQHPGCIALALGEPDFPTPDVISAEVTASLDRGDTHYPPNNGRPALREALAAYMGDAGLVFSADEVILTDGATEALSATFMAMLNPGDEVIIPTPAFGLYESIVMANHAKAVFLDTEPTQFQIDEDALRACVTPATKAIVICSPNNPTGCILDAASLDAVAHVAEQAGIYVVCDDVYNRLVYVDGYERFAQRHPELREQTVVIESFSKPWAMTGWRLGWLAAAAPVIAEIAKAHQYLVSSAVSFEMDAARVALTVDPAPMLKVYRARRERVLAALGAMGLDVVEPAGAFYAFPSIKKFGLTSEAFCIKAIKEANVALVPGDCFGTEGHIRLSYCVSDKDLDEGLNRLSTFISTLYPNGTQHISPPTQAL